MTERAGTRWAVVGGAGGVGSLFRERLRAEGFEAVTIDMRSDGSPDCIVCDIRHGDVRSRAALHAADAVLCCLPERVQLEALPLLLECMRDDALLVDTTSVKAGVASALADANPPCELLSINPMFAPTVPFTGQAVAAVELRSGQRAATLIALIEHWGARVVRLSAEQHDRVTLAAQVLVHGVLLSYAAALDEIDVDVEALLAIAPPPCHTLLALVSRLASLPRHVVCEVQHAHPLADEAWRAIARSVARLDEGIVRGVGHEPAGVLDDAERLLGRHGSELTADCRRLFTALQR